MVLFSFIAVRYIISSKYERYKMATPTLSQIRSTMERFYNTGKTQKAFVLDESIDLQDLPEGVNMEVWLKYTVGTTYNVVDLPNGLVLVYDENHLTHSEMYNKNASKLTKNVILGKTVILNKDFTGLTVNDAINVSVLLTQNEEVAAAAKKARSNEMSIEEYQDFLY